MTASVCPRCATATEVEPAAVGYWCRHCDLAFTGVAAERAREWHRRVALAGARTSDERREVEERFAAELGR